MLRLVYWLLDLTTGFFNFLWRVSNKYSTARIKKLARKDSHSAVKERRRLFMRRRIIKTTYHILASVISACAGLFLIIWGFWGQYSERWEGLTTLFLIISGTPFLTIAVGSIKALREEGIGNISTAETSDIIGSGIPYALYLRAFKADSRRSVFREEQLAQTLYSQGVLMATVGLPEEVDAPPGALRIYISNDTWKEEVRLMLDCAGFVLLRICNTEPCLWEVSQALSSQKDLYVIVDNIQEYSIVHEKYPQLPVITELQPDEYALYRRIGTAEWENLTPHKQQLESSSQSNEVTHDKSEQSSFNKAFISSLLKRFPKLPDNASLEQFEESIDGLYTNIVAGADHALKIRVASRIMDLLEAYCAKGCSEERITNNLQRYLNMFERFNPLPEGLQSRKDDLLKKLIITR